MDNFNKKSYEICEIVTDNGSFQIYGDQNSNLYWTPCLGNEDLVKSSFEYIITDDDVFVSRAFDILYNSIVNKESNNSNSDLVKDGKIEWHSDDFSYDVGSVLSIEKDADANYHITFNRSKNVADDMSMFYTFAVQINNANSRYDSCAESFINMYEGLKKHNEFPNNLYYAIGLCGKKRVRTR